MLDGDERVIYIGEEDYFYMEAKTDRVGLLEELDRVGEREERGRAGARKVSELRGTAGVATGLLVQRDGCHEKKK
ncbi:hypothetical protein KSP40_PGU013003 [Platanthera guangdongensis]|uniref:Uncharacterized protein n=1 Tax=Platanthera guangdongensis TaxID=2320717 RepID=A0ABR2LQH8_9ASPA